MSEFDAEDIFEDNSSDFVSSGFDPKNSKSYEAYVREQYPQFYAQNRKKPATHLVSKEEAENLYFVMGEFGNGVQRAGTGTIQVYAKGVRQEPDVTYTLETWTQLINDAVSKESTFAAQYQREPNITFK